MPASIGFIPELVAYCVSEMPCSTARTMFGPVTSRPCASPAAHSASHSSHRPRASERVDLIAGLAAPAGVRDDRLDAGDPHRRAPVPPELRDVAVGEPGEDVRGSRALELHRRDVGLGHGRVVAACQRDPRGPQAQVDVGVREPDDVVPGAKDDALAHDRAGPVADGRVAALAHLEIGEPPRGEVVGQRECPRAAQLALALGADIPQGHPLDQGAVVVARVAAVPHRHVRVVVDHEVARPVRERALEVRRPADGGVEHLGSIIA